MIDLATAYRRRHWSRDHLAKRVLKRWNPTEKTSHRNLSNQIAGLEKGSRTWWQKRPDAARALAEELDVDLEELELERDAAGRGTALAFHDFPAVRPFDPKTEAPCEIGNEEWFNFKAITAGPRSLWIHAPAGTGWTLLGEVYRQRYGVAVQSVRTLSEVAEQSSTEWIVAQVRAPNDESDLAVERWLSKRNRTIICAPFLHWAGRHGMQLFGFGAGTWSLESQPADFEPPSDVPSWDYSTWSPTQGWRERFVQWLVDRVEVGVQFNVERLLSWLNERDPSANLFASPADVLALAGFAHEVGTKSWTESAYEKLPVRWMATRIKADPASVAERWLAGAARDAMIPLIHRWVESSAPWLTPQTRATWQAWLPEPPPAARALELERHLAELDARLPPAKRSEKKQALLAAATRADSDGLLLKLEADRVLVPGQRPGDWRFQPTWLAAWLGEQHVDALVREGSVETWGRMAIFPDRQPLVDRALDRLEGPRFEAAIRHVVSRFALSSLPSVAAVESLFLAVGRRLFDGQAFPTSTLAALWECAVISLDKRSERQPPVFLTRRGPGEGDEGLEWVGVCWEWSNALQKPAVVPANAEWLFPGWFPLSFDNSPKWLNGLPRPNHQFLLVAEALIGARATGELRSAPLWMRAPALLARLKRGADLTSEDVAPMARDPDSIQYLLSRASEISPEARARLARDLFFWTSSQPLRDRATEAALRGFFNENLSGADLLQMPMHVSVLREAISRVSPSLQREVLWHWLDHHPEELAMLLGRAQEIDGETLGHIAERLEPVGAAARLLWKRDPERALCITQRDLRERPGRAAAWFYEGGWRHHLPLLALLEALQKPPEWADSWLAKLMIAQPESAERIHALRLRFRS
jgi:hypothetical protein